MQYDLKNDHLHIKVNKKGAELTSLKNITSGIEHLWQADPSVWGRHAPILFPIVGQVENNTYTIGSDTYELSQHGFARDMDFEITSQEAHTIEFKLKSDEATLKKYPYQFELFIKYELHENNLKISYRVVNIDGKDIYFSIGAHPGFTCPFKEDQFKDYYLEFEKNETVERIEFEDGLLNGKTSDFLDNEKIIPCKSNMFDQDAIIFENLQSKWVALKSTQHQHELRFHFEGFPFLAFWSKPGANAPYICIEPWFGITDTQGDKKDYTQKRGIQHLTKGSDFNSSYSISLS